jgi:hypothetical protein
MQAWFAELGLDRRFLSSPIHAVDAFEKITRPAGSGLAICWTALSRRRGDADGRTARAVRRLQGGGHDGSDRIYQRRAAAGLGDGPEGADGADT